MILGLSAYILISIPYKGLRLPRLTRNMSFLGVMLGTP
jgi:hypothetical protein